MRNLFTVKSSECIDLLFKLHTSKPYNRIGIHFCFGNCTMTSSEVNLPTLAKILFAARKKSRLFHAQIVHKPSHTSQCLTDPQ